jgi:hypothetical protein
MRQEQALTFRPRLGQVAFGGRFLADPPEEAEEGLARVT